MHITIKAHLRILERKFDKRRAINKGEFGSLWKRVAVIEKRLKMQR